jgi:hypothetical protein
MFPMRDHLYELAQAREMELMEMARREQQLLEAQNYGDEDRWMATLRRMWQKLSGRMMDRQATGQHPTLPGYGAFQG